MAGRAEMAAASYESLRAQHEQVMMLRHDMNRHLQHAAADVQGKRLCRAYLDELIGQNENIPAILQSGNRMIDIILNGRLAAAKAAGIDVEIHERAGPGNAAHARRRPLLADAEPHRQRRRRRQATRGRASGARIRLDLRVKGSFFVFACENTCGTRQASLTATDTGWG